MNTRVVARLRDRAAYLASADSRGRPHLTVAHVDEVEDDRVRLSGWLCPRTLENLDANPSVSVTVRLRDEGYQIEGTVVEKTVEAVLDGYAPEEEPGIPQARYRLVIRPEHLSAMGDRPHSDRELSG